jgi:hypothetical protein
MTRSRFAPLTVAVAFAACRGDEAPDALAVQEWTVIEELRIGSVDDENQMLTAVQDIVVDGTGRVYVAQPQDNVVRVFDEEGRFVRTIGGPGQGPGEFERLVAIGLLADTLYAADLTSRRVAFFSLEGDLLGTVTIRPPVEPPFSAFGADMMYADGSVMAPVGVPVGMPGLDVSRVPWLRVNRQGEILDTLATSSYEGRWTSTEGSNGDPVIINQTFDDEALIAVARDGTRVARVERPAASAAAASSFRVTVTDPFSDDTVFSRTYDYLPVRMDQAIADSAIAQSARVRLRFFASAAAAEAAVREAMTVPEYFLPASRAEYSETGELWLKREDLPDADQTWWVIDDRGDIVARVTLPVGFDPRLFRADEIWGVMPDELDVPYVVKYGIVR